MKKYLMELLIGLLVALLAGGLLLYKDKTTPPTYENATPVFVTVNTPIPGINIENSNCVAVGLENNDQTVTCEFSTPTR